MRAQQPAENAVMPGAPLGAIDDTNSKGRYDLVVYRDGILGAHGTYLGVAMLGSGAGMGTLGGAAWRDRRRSRRVRRSPLRGETRGGVASTRPR